MPTRQVDHHFTGANNENAMDQKQSGTDAGG